MRLNGLVVDYFEECVPCLHDCVLFVDESTMEQRSRLQVVFMR